MQQIKYQKQRTIGSLNSKNDKQEYTQFTSDNEDLFGCPQLQNHWIKIYEREGMPQNEMLRPEFGVIGQYLANQLFD